MCTIWNARAVSLKSSNLQIWKRILSAAIPCRCRKRTPQTGDGSFHCIQHAGFIVCICDWFSLTIDFYIGFILCGKPKILYRIFVLSIISSVFLPFLYGKILHYDLCLCHFYKCTIFLNFQLLSCCLSVQRKNGHAFPYERTVTVNIDRFS